MVGGITVRHGSPRGGAEAARRESEVVFRRSRGWSALTFSEPASGLFPRQGMTLRGLTCGNGRAASALHSATLASGSERSWAENLPSAQDREIPHYQRKERRGDCEPPSQEDAQEGLRGRVGRR
jgi:hypothetical protein